jgi:hypothetical protein
MRRLLPTLGTLAAAAALTAGFALPSMAHDRMTKPGWVPWPEFALTMADHQPKPASWVPWSRIGTDADLVWTVADNVGKPSAITRADRLDRESRPLSVAAQSEEIDVIVLPVDPQIAEADEVMPGAMTAIDDALRSLRSVALHDPRIAAVLHDEGVTADDVIGVVRTGDALTVIVGNA